MVTCKDYIGGIVMSKAILNELRSYHEAIGRRIAFGSLPRLKDVREEIETRFALGEITQEIYSRYLEGFSYSPFENLPSARSFLLVAVPIGRSILELDLESGPFTATIPPTYGADELIAEEEILLAKLLKPRSIRFAKAWLPLKILAAHTGLACYGRDNVLRFEGAGSYVRLDAWWTELEAEGEHWGEPRALDRCASCGACVVACPNGCIIKGNFIIDSSKCLTYMNEGPGPFPSWLRPDCHNAVVGCLRCQDACPENQNVPGRSVYRRIVLDREASELLLSGRPIAELPDSAATAVRAAEMVGCEGKLARNLRALIAAKAWGSRVRA
jgi:epoxyqueuosine reductase